MSKKKLEDKESKRERGQWEKNLENPKPLFTYKGKMVIFKRREILENGLIIVFLSLFLKYHKKLRACFEIFSLEKLLERFLKKSRNTSKIPYNIQGHGR